MHDQDQRRQFLRGFPPRPDHPPRHAAHHDRRRCRALHRAVRRPLRGAVVGRLRQGDRLSRTAPLDDLLVFHIVFGKTVPDVSLNAVANLGYAGMQFLAPVFAGDTLSATSEVIGLKENSNRKTGIVYVRTRGVKQDGSAGARIRALGDGAKARRGGAGARRSRAAAADRGRAEASGRRLPADRRRRPTTSRWPEARIASATMRSARRSTTSTASPSRRPSTRPRRGSTRTPRASTSISFSAAQGRFGKRLIYGGHVISLARAISFNGLANAFHIAADQRRAPRRAAVRRRHGVRLVGGAGGERTAGPERCRRAAAAHRRDARTGRAPTSPTRTARTTTPPFCSISTTGR